MSPLRRTSRFSSSILVASVLAVLGACSDSGGGGVTCAATETLCTDRCVSVADDPKNCGACGVACGAGQTCSGGACATSCPTGEAACDDGKCHDLQTDRLACGACKKACADGEICSAGACAVSCGAGLTECSGTCRDLKTDRLHCGDCAKACADGEVCSAGTCAVSCGAGLTECSGTCRDLKTDRLHCGDCAKACADGEICSAGTCAVSCGAGLTECSGTCRDLKTDRLHCGDCAKACADGEICSAGACAVSCGAGLTECSGTCRDLKTDRLHCGDCAKACAAGEVCSGGTCAASCASPLVECHGACVDPRFDPSSCGGCDKVCAPGANAKAACVAGTCAPGPCLAGFADCDASAANGCEIDLTTSLANCGACKAACAPAHATPKCAASTCSIGSCDTGYKDCDGAVSNGCETATASDGKNCGACGNVCPGTQTCSNGTCVQANSCKAILASQPSAPSGLFTIDVDGSGPLAPTSVYCDMVTDGGGWTVMAYIKSPTQWSWALYSDQGTPGDTTGGFAQGATLKTLNDSFTEKLIVYLALVENGTNLGKQWMAVKRSDSVAIPFATLDTAATGWSFRDSFGHTDASAGNVCTHGCTTYRTHGMFHDYSGIQYHGTQGGDYGCRDGNNICWMSRGLGCNVGGSRCANLINAGEGVYYAVR
jgi:hypothetical protein